MDYPDYLPALHARFLDQALPILQADSRIVGVSAAGSYVTGGMDDLSDVDLVIACEPDDFDALMADRRKIAAGLGNLLGAFTGEHVGEPRLLICLYGPTPLHVDLKFVSLDDAANRIEDPAILFERDGRVTAALAETPPVPPVPDYQWVEDRFWIWIHYGATKIARGELFEAHGFLGFLRQFVLGPLALQTREAQATGVRKIEMAAGDLVPRLRETLGDYDKAACSEALEVCAVLYVELRDQLAPADLIRGKSAEIAAMETLAALRQD